MNSTLTSVEGKRIKTIELIAFVIASILGVIFHFLYNWTGQIRFIGFFVPVNESIWEHLKLIFYPITIVSLAEYYLCKIRTPDFLCIKVRSIWVGMLSTVVIFYTYVGVWGGVIEWLNIVVYFIAMAIAYCFSCKRLIHSGQTKNTPILCIVSFAVVAILFMIFSLYPPAIGIFAVP